MTLSSAYARWQQKQGNNANDVHVVPSLLGLSGFVPPGQMAGMHSYMLHPQVQLPLTSTSRQRWHSGAGIMSDGDDDASLAATEDNSDQLTHPKSKRNTGGRKGAGGNKKAKQ